jgi:hypothetical protein
MWALPVVMLLATTVLMFLASGQEMKEPHSSDTPFEFQPPARLFSELLNGPGFDVTLLVPGVTLFGRHLYDFGRLIGVAIFWAWIGWGLDGRFRGTSKTIIRAAWVRAGIYAVLLAFCVLFIWATLSDLHSDGLLFSPLLRNELRAEGLWLAVLTKYATMTWLLVGSIYFCTQFLNALKASRMTVDHG